MKSNIIKVCAIALLAVQTIAIAQKTEVTVKKGRVIAETSTRTVAIEAGRKAVLSPDKNPVVTIDDPMVDDLIEMYKWVEAEKEAEREPIESATIIIARVEDEHLVTFASLQEKANTSSKPSKMHRIQGSFILEEPSIYDLQGNLLQFDTDKISAQSANYTLHFTNPVKPGEMFRYIVVSKFRDQIKIQPNNALWHLTGNVGYANNLIYCRIILPQSAIFVDSNWPATMVDSINNQVAVTCRHFSGPIGNGMFHFAFLWPDKDGTTLADLPRQYRGLRDSWDREVLEEAKLQSAKILAGGTYEDQSTPLKTMLTLNSAITHRDKGLFLRMIYDKGLRKIAAGQFDAVLGLFGNSTDEFDLLGTPPWPEEPEDGDTYPVYMCRKGSLLCEATITTVYQDGKWYLQGFEFGRKRTDDSESTSQKTSGGVTISSVKGDLAHATYEGLEPGRFMKKWLFLGPTHIPWNGEGYFPDNKTAKAFFDIDLLSTDKFQPKVAIGEKEFEWSLLKSEYGVIDLTGPFDDWYIVGYAWARINMPEETRGVLGIGSDDSVKVWLNGKLVHNHWVKTGRAACPDNDKVNVTFRKGTNHLVLKIQNGGGPWGFVCRLLEE